MQEYRYTVILQPEADGGYSVFVPALPGCHTQGETETECLHNAQEAIQCYIESLLKDNLPVPQELQPVIQTVQVVA